MLHSYEFFHIQTYFADSRAKINSPIYEILKQCELNQDHFYELSEFCKNIDIKFASTPFCKDSFHILNQLNCSFIKIASFHLTNYELLRTILEKSNIEEIIIIMLKDHTKYIKPEVLIRKTGLPL